MMLIFDFHRIDNFWNFPFICNSFLKVTDKVAVDGGRWSRCWYLLPASSDWHTARTNCVNHRIGAGLANFDEATDKDVVSTIFSNRYFNVRKRFQFFV